MESFELLLAYLLRVLPSLAVGVCFILLINREQFLTRIFAYIMLFIVLRDVMTPLNIWDFGTEGLFWLRTIDDPVFLLAVSIISICTILVVNTFDKEARHIFCFVKSSYLHSIALGIAGAVVITLPMAIIYWFVPIEVRGGVVNSSGVFLSSLLFFCISVNFLEESIYRGYFQGYMLNYYSPFKSAILSGFLFSFSHIFLATTVTNAGVGVLIFTLYEGIIAGLVYNRAGVLGSSFSHGLAIFVLCSGLI